MQSKFIMGVEPLPKYDDYVKQLQALRIDELLVVWQNRYEEMKK